MDEHEDRRRWSGAAVDVEPLDLGRPVGDPLGLADAPAHIGAVADAALDQLLAVWRIGSLVKAESSAAWSYSRNTGRPFSGIAPPLFVLPPAVGRNRGKRGVKLYTYYGSQASFRVGVRSICRCWCRP